MQRIIFYFYTYEAPWGVWGTEEKGKGNKDELFRETGEQRQYSGTGNIRIQSFDFWGTGERTNLFQGNEGTDTPWESLIHSLFVSLLLKAITHL